ncbi:hypothetical protein S40288_03283 [Stachybotrys chartarum IBT 40288]|nr:hypothetical protein S40288_03283 [Stachybotrys chartarum IBT 40288]
MRISQLLALAAPAMALPSMVAPRSSGIRPFVPAGKTDSRGPCPMMNTLANHGYLPHNGRNITVENIADAIFAATNWSRDFGLIPGANTFAILGAASVIDLEDLNNRTSTVERPASLARADDSNTVLPARVRRVLDDSPDRKYITANSFGITRHRLETVSPLPAAGQGAARGEAAFVLMLVGKDAVPAASDTSVDRATFKAFKDQAYVFLAEERLPVELGWEPSERVVTLADIGPFSAAIAASQNAQS